MNNSDALRETCLIMYPIASYASSYIVWDGARAVYRAI